LSKKGELTEPCECQGGASGSERFLSHPTFPYPPMVTESRTLPVSAQKTGCRVPLPQNINLWIGENV